MAANNNTPDSIGVDSDAIHGRAAELCAIDALADAHQLAIGSSTDCCAADVAGADDTTAELPDADDGSLDERRAHGRTGRGEHGCTDIATAAVHANKSAIM